MRDKIIRIEWSKAIITSPLEAELPTGEVIYIEFVETPKKTAHRLTTNQILLHLLLNNPKNT